MTHSPSQAPEFTWDVSEWLNSPPLPLAELRGKVVFIEVFQMLCPTCVTHAIPQAKLVSQLVHDDQLAVIGLHSVFEHHESMNPDALKVFCAEFGVTFPVGVDRPSVDGVLPATMKQWRLQGTPTTILLDRAGRVRQTWFGKLDDLVLGVWLGTLLSEDA